MACVARVEGILLARVDLPVSVDARGVLNQVLGDRQSVTPPGRFCAPSPLTAIWQGSQVMQAGMFAAMPEEVRVVAAGRLGSVCWLLGSITVPVHEPHEGAGLWRVTVLNAWFPGVVWLVPPGISLRVLKWLVCGLWSAAPGGGVVHDADHLADRDGEHDNSK
jgi:hypothetical protein